MSSRPSLLAPKKAGSIAVKTRDWPISAMKNGGCYETYGDARSLEGGYGR